MPTYSKVGTIVPSSRPINYPVQIGVVVLVLLLPFLTFVNFNSFNFDSFYFDCIHRLAQMQFVVMYCFGCIHVHNYDICDCDHDGGEHEE